MPLKLNVGVSRKLGLPEFSSAGASCNIEVELDSNLLHDASAFHAEARNAFIAAQQAVQEELLRLKGQSAAPTAQGTSLPHSRSAHNGSRLSANGALGRTRGPREDTPRVATSNQVRAILGIARARDLDLESLLRDEFGVDQTEGLTLAQASKLIDELKTVGQR